MCMQCLTDPVTYSKRIGEFVLMQATKDSQYGEWKSGMFGLVRVNDPDFYFTSVPLPVKDNWINREYDIPDEEADEYWKAAKRAAEIEDEMLTYMPSFYCMAKLFASVGAVNQDTIRIEMLIMQKLYDAFSSQQLNGVKTVFYTDFSGEMNKMKL